MGDADNPDICAHEPCKCEVSDDGTERNGKRYCSQGCLEGKGCKHADCNCYVPQVPG
jgi:hypothetical protein